MPYNPMPCHVLAAGPENRKLLHEVIIHHFIQSADLVTGVLFTRAIGKKSYRKAILL